MTEQEWLSYKENYLLSTIQYYKDVPLPSQIEFNLIAACTRRCSFCPVSNEGYYKKLYGSDKIFDSSKYKELIDELAIYNYSQMISFSGFCEPLLYPELGDIISYTRLFLPRSSILVVTNGDLLTKSKVENLIKSGCNTISISVYEEKNEEFFYNLKEHYKNDINIFPRRRFFNGSDNGIIYSNRTDSANTFSGQCFYPFYSIMIDVSGEVRPCTHDAFGQINLGSVLYQSIFDIWTSDSFNNLRRQLSAGDRSAINACSHCNVKGILHGKYHYDAWKNHIQT